MTLNLFFVLLVIVVIVCISMPNRIFNTANCKRHWVAILTISSVIIGLRGFIEWALVIQFTLLIVVTSVWIHKVVKNYTQIHIE